MDGFYLALSLTTYALFVEYVQGVGMVHARYFALLTKFAAQCGKKEIICNVNSRLEKIYARRFGFKVIKRTEKMVFGVAEIISTMSRVF